MRCIFRLIGDLVLKQYRNESHLKRRVRAQQVFDILVRHYPNVTTFLNHGSPFQLLVAVILSAQCTDERINRVTPDLFDTFPTAESLAGADPDHVEQLIRSVTYYKTKANHLVAMALKLTEQFSGQVPCDLESLVSLPGVGRKTANVVLGQAFGVPGITVDTHVNRLSRRLGFSKRSEAIGIERDLMELWPPELWTPFSTQLIVHARAVCPARSPKCQVCAIRHLCPSASTT